MNKKTLYTTPETELLVVRFEENILSGPNSANDGYDDNDLGEI